MGSGLSAPGGTSGGFITSPCVRPQKTKVVSRCKSVIVFAEVLSLVTEFGKCVSNAY